MRGGFSGFFSFTLPDPSIFNSDLAKVLFGRPSVTFAPTSLVPLASDVYHRRPIWLGLIAFFFSKRFLLPFAKLSMFPVSTLVNEYAGSHWLILVFAASAWLETL